MRAQGTCLLSVLLYLSGCSRAAKWSYEGDSGPESWHKLFPEACSGRAQSPIDIQPERTLYDPSLKEFAIWYDPPRPGSRMVAHNNGHSVQVNLHGDFFVTNAGLPSVYKSVQFHFHWGHSNHQGSEHTIDGVASPLEMHVVNYNKDRFPSIVDAVTQPQGLAVLGVLFKVSEKDNEALKPFVDVLDLIQEPDDGTVEMRPASLRSLLPEDISRYYRYNGSLTTPNCFESVVWTVFDRKATISHRQLRKFRQVLQHRHRKHNKGGHRHRRRSNRMRRAEQQAEAVLDEMGIRGDKMQEAQLKMEMKERAANQEHPPATPEHTPAAEPGPSEAPPSGHHRPHAPSVNARLDEDAAKKADENMMQRYKDFKPEEVQAAAQAEAEKEDEELQEYIQNYLVNNFRPVQQLNGRLVYRSFKLSAPPRVMQDPVVVDVQQVHSSSNRADPSPDPHDAASGVRFSVVTVLLAALLAMLRDVFF